jgi:hypothetical protein
LFLILHDNGVNYDPRSVKEYLRTKFKWNILAADQAARIAEEIRSGKRYGDSDIWRGRFWKDDDDDIF